MHLGMESKWMSKSSQCYSKITACFLQKSLFCKIHLLWNFVGWHNFFRHFPMFSFKCCSFCPIEPFRKSNWKLPICLKVFSVMSYDFELASGLIWNDLVFQTNFLVQCLGWKGIGVMNLNKFSKKFYKINR